MNVDVGSVAAFGDGSVTLVSGRDFAISDSRGDMVRGAVHGLIHEDRRFLDIWCVSISGHELRPLAVAVPSPFHGLFVSRVHEHDGHPLPVLVVRRRSVGRGMRETIELHSSAREAVRLELSLEIGADFGHLFDVKAGVTPAFHGTAARGDDGAGLAILPTPGVDLATFVSTEPEADVVSDHRCSWVLEVAPHDVVRVSVDIEPRVGGRSASEDVPAGSSTVDEISRHRFDSWREQVPEVSTSDVRLATTVRRSLEDLASLRIFDTAHPELAVLAAGAPWFMTLFGRDSLLTASMALPFAPDLARGVLHELAALQGRVVDPISGEEPGKILHELRSSGGDGPFSDRSRYYGTVDATPLYVVVAAEAFRWGALSTADRQWLIPAVDGAITWIREYGDSDGDGFVDYGPHHGGLDNQGWKDSWDGVNFANGTLPTGPIALVEVQAYVHAALIGAAGIYRAVGRPQEAARCERDADRLRRSFEEQFWDDRGWYVQALDGRGRQVDSLGSNPGHALWTGIADHERANIYLDTVMGAEMWSGWGIRTLATTMEAYDPLSYHNGSVWPHDTALLVAGAARYGRWDVVDRLTDGLLDAAMHFGGRLPELFSGVSRDVVPVPVMYPGSCSPQAWAAASILLVLRANLGLDVDAATRSVMIDPRGAIASDVTCRRLIAAGRHFSLGMRDGSLAVEADGLNIIDRPTRTAHT